MPLRYVRRASWKGHGLHEETPHVLALAINPDGKWLLSGGLDGFVRIWALDSGHLLAESRVGLPIVSLEWPAHRREVFYAGCTSGVSLSCSVVGKTSLAVAVQRNPAYDLGAVQHVKAAQTAQEDVVITATTFLATIWTVGYLDRGSWQKVADVPALPEHTSDTEAEVAISSVHWLNDPVVSDGVVSGKVLCTYLWHGATCWDMTTYTALWTIPRSGCGYSDVSPDHRYLATLDMRRGLSVFDLRTRQTHVTAPVDQGTSAAPLPVLYIHNGNAVATGTCTGKVRIWNTDGNHPIQMQKLPHEHARTPALAEYCHDVDQQVILASSSTDGHIYIWEACPTAAYTFDTSCAKVFLRLSIFALVMVACGLAVYLGQPSI